MSFSYDICWGPGSKDLFILAWNHDIYLFSIHNSVGDLPENSFTIGRNHQFTLTILGIWRNLIHPQCVVWMPCIDDRDASDESSEQLIAVSAAGGDVKLLSFQETSIVSDRFGLHNKELVAKYPRGSVCLAWNPWKRNLLAQVVDKTRHPREPSILIWDVTKSTGSRPAVPQPATRDPIAATRIPFPMPLSGLPSTSDSNAFPVSHAVTKVLPVYGVACSKQPTSDATVVVTCDRTLCDIGTQETTSSFAWLTKSSFIAGMSGTYLKVFDLSDPTKPCQITSTRAVNGLTVDPLCSNRIASFCERQVAIWKVDSLEKPVYTFTEASDVCQIKWSPLKQAWLGVLVADSCSVKLYDTFPMFLQPMDESEQFSFEHRVFASGRPNCPLLAFSWHPSLANCLMTLDREGCLDIAELIERPAAAWSPEQALVWCHGGQWTTCDPWSVKSSRVVQLLNPSKPLEPAREITDHAPESSEPIGDGLEEPLFPPSISRHSNEIVELQQHLADDIASVMRRRAELGYGMGRDPELYISIVGETTSLGTMWRWIKYIQDYLDDSAIRYRGFDNDLNRSSAFKETSSLPRAFTRCLGAVSVLSGESSPSGSPSVSEVLAYAKWQDVEARLPFSRYRSPERSHVLRLCMWPLDDSDDVQRRVFQTLCNSGQYERAATMALINLKFNWALAFLNQGASAQHVHCMSDNSGGVAKTAIDQQDTALVTLALAGYANARNDLWQTTCANLITRLKNPYLRMMFTFLSRQGSDFDPILFNSDLCLIDRVAFACLYLNDDDLLTYVRSVCNRMVRAGALEAVLLTGLASTDFISLIQHYVDATGDVQTAAIVGLHACQLASSVSRGPVSSPSSGGNSAGGGEGRGTDQTLSRQTSVIEEEKQISRVGFASSRSTQLDRSVPLLRGGARLANWVQCYRDLLDQWRMWFNRANFDITYKSRLLSDSMVTTSGGKPAASLLGSSTASIVRSTESTVTTSGSGVSSSTKPVVSPNVPHTPTKVRNFGLVTAANQVFVACGFCGWRLGPQTRSSVPATGSLSGSGSMTTGSNSTTLSLTASVQKWPMHGGGGKHTICQHCRKPLPRCAICLMHLGTVAPTLSESTSTNPLMEDALRQSAINSVPAITDHMARALQLSIHGPASQGPGILDTPLKRSAQSKQLPRIPASMANWFVWCQACRHGGHANHLAEWFYGTWSNAAESEYHSQCPVSGCQCRCASLDSMQPSPWSHVVPSGSAAPRTNLTRSISVNSNELSQDEEEEDEVNADTRPLGLDDFVLRSAYLTSYGNLPDDSANLPIPSVSTFQALSTSMGP